MTAFRQQRLFFSLFLIILICSGEETEKENATNQNTEEVTSNASTMETNGASTDKDRVPVFLPTLEVQYICIEDIRPGFNTMDTFQDLYHSILPDMGSAHLTVTERMSGMDTILKAYGQKKLDMWGCNTTSAEVLMTFKVKGFAYFDRSSPDIAKMNEVINQDAVHNYFATQVCSNNTQFRAFVESPFRKESKSDEFDQVHHNVDVLCAGGNYYRYDDNDEEGDPVFVLFGIFVGYYMVRMIASEFQQYGRNRRTRNYEELAYEEVEMI